MLSYFIRRLIYMIISLIALSFVSFIIIQLPPGDYLSTYIMSLKQQSQVWDEAKIAALEHRYGLDKPMYVQYFSWMGKMLHGNLGMSFEWQTPVTKLISRRITLTIIISLLSSVFVYAVAIPIGIYSATHQYSAGDYTFTIFGFAGLAIPNFLLALILMFTFYKYFGLNVAGLFSSQYLTAPWSQGKVINMLMHFPVPIIVIGTAGTAGIIRVMRGCLLDEIQKQYVITARAKGVEERALLFKYPVRMAINPIISTVGWILPSIFSGAIITAIVLGLPTIGPLLYKALLSQDMYLAGSIIMILGALTIIGILISDILLAYLDPRIRYEKGV